MVAQEIANLEGTVAAMQSDFEKTLNANMASQKDLQDNLVSAKHDLLRIQEQLALAEKVITIITLWFLPFKGKVLLNAVIVYSAICFLLLQELEKKFQQTAAYRNMKEILTKKNEQIKDLRKRLQRYTFTLHVMTTKLNFKWCY